MWEIYSIGDSAYLAAILVEARVKRDPNDSVRAECDEGPDSFGRCLHAYEELFAGIDLTEPVD